MSKTGWHDLRLPPAHFYQCTGYQQWWLAKRYLDLSPGDGWRWSTSGDHVLVAAVEGSPETPFPEPPDIQRTYNKWPHAGWDGVEWPKGDDA